jgi:hypothetical protein
VHREDCEEADKDIQHILETSLAEYLAELGRKMKITRKHEDSLLDIDGITAQVSIARPWSRDFPKNRL